MRREQLEHVIRAAADLADDDTIVIVGSQAILGSHPAAPAEMLRSMEADIYPRHHPERAIVIDGAIGEGSPFHETFGYYAHGVGPETAVVSEGWEDRLVEVRNANTRDARGLCLDPHDLVAAKLAAGREHDVAFATAALRAGIVVAATLSERIDSMQLAKDRAEHVRGLLRLAQAHTTERGAT